MEIIFDLDGTLFQTDQCIIQAVNTLCEENSFPQVPESVVRSSIGKKTQDFLKDILPLDLISNSVIDRFRAIEQKQVKQSGVLYEDTIPTLIHLRSLGHKLYLCSNGSKEYMELVLNTTNAIQYFDGLYSAKAYMSKSEAISTIKNICTRPVIIGDTDSDYKAASDCRIPFVFASYGFGSWSLSDRATFTLKRFTDIIPCTYRLEIFYSIYEKTVNEKWRTVGINGVDTSGKTMFTNSFSRFLDNIHVKNQVIHIDDYHNPSAIRKQGKDEIDAYYRNAFNYDQLINEVLQPARLSKIDKTVTCLNLSTDQYDLNVHYSIDFDSIILLEGVLLFRPPLDEYIDGKVFIDISFDTVMKRAKMRDVPIYGEQFLEKYQKKYIPIQKRYLDEYSPQKKSDTVIDNNDYDHPAVIRI